MSQTTQINLEAELENEKMTVGDLDQLKQQVYADKDLHKSLEGLLSGWQEAGGKSKPSYKARWILNQHSAVIEQRGQLDDVQQVLKGRSLLALSRAEEAQAVFAELGRSAEKIAAAVGLAEAATSAGDLTAAQKAITKLEKTEQEKPDLHYVTGLLHDRKGDYLDAQACYEKAIELDDVHAPALFRLAYNHDLRGDEEEAMDYYQQCAELQPTYVNCLLNLGVLHEDRNEFDEAMQCYRQVLDFQPNHLRARLFIKDARASLEMYFDEDQARLKDRENLILNIPVTDFELSVRSRNCLNKMNIRKLGDLVQKTEAELLSYKNFGETSLMEIKEILAKKGLKLGQGRLADSRSLGIGMLDNPLSSSEEIGKSALDIDFSVRVRTALKTLNLATLGDLARRTSRELLTCKNFGQTSLDEVRQVLSKYGMSLADEPQ